MITIARHRPPMGGAIPLPRATREGLRRVAVRALPAMATVLALAGLLLAVNPHVVLTALRGFDGAVLLPVLLLTLAFYALQGLRWHLLLRAVGAAPRLADSELINLAGQSVSAVLPLGDLTRAMLATEASGVPFGATAATVTVQELAFTLLLVLSAAPGLARLPGGPALMLLVAGGVAAVVAVLTVPAAFAGVRRLIAVTPGVRRFLAEIETLQAAVGALLRRRDVLAGSVFDLGRVAVATAAFALILRGVHVDVLGWWQVSLVLAVSYVGGALSFLPGGIGANEAGVVGVLVLLGVNPAAAAAAAILQRLTLTGVGTLGGAVAYLAVRRRARAASGFTAQPAASTAR